MKTSKKLLSFFLAVVMVVTTCSVGFTAFAQDNSNSIWSTSDEADAAFNSLNGLIDDYLPSLLLGIDSDGFSIEEMVFEKYAKILGKSADDLTDHEKAVIRGDDERSDADPEGLQAATLQDILTALQPMLIKILDDNNITDGMDQLTGTKLSSKTEFLRAFYEEFYPDRQPIENNYAYLDSRDSDISYFTIMKLCMKYKDSIGGEAGETLQNWYDTLLPLAHLYEEYNASLNTLGATVETVARRYGDNFKSACLYDLEQFFKPVTDEGEDSTVSYENITSEELEAFNTLYAMYGAAISSVSSNAIEIDTPAELIYYIYGAGMNLIYVYLYYDYIHKSGTAVTFSGEGEFFEEGNEVKYNITADITPENYAELLALGSIVKEEITPENYADLLAEASENGSLDAFYANLDANADRAKSVAQNYALAAYYNEIIKGGKSNAYEGPYYLDILKGYAVDKGYVKTADELDEMVSELMPEGWKEKDSVLTDAQLADMASVLTSINGNSSSLLSYYAGESVAFTDASSTSTEAVIPSVLKDSIVTEYLTMIAEETSSDTDAHRLGVFQAFIGSDAYRKPTYASEPYRIVSRLNVSQASRGPIGHLDTSVDPYAGIAYDATGLNRDVEIFNDYATMTNALKTSANDANGTITAMVVPQSYYDEYLADDSAYRLIRGEYNVYTDRSNKDEAGNTHLVVTNASPQIGSVDGRDDQGNIQENTINGYFAEAENYAYAKVVAEFAGIDLSDLAVSSKTRLPEILNVDQLIENEFAAILEESGTSNAIELTEEQKAILNADYDFTGEAGTELINAVLNDLVAEVFTLELSGQSISQIINNFLETGVDLNSVLEDLWSKLVNSPVETIFELLPVLVVLLDELIIPFIANENTDASLIYNLDLFNDFKMEYGSYVGITKLNWDLNDLLPKIMHWLFEGDEAEGIEYYTAETVTFKEEVDNELVTKDYLGSEIDTADLKNYVIKDQNGNQIIRTDTDRVDEDGNVIAEFTYLNNTSTDLEALLAEYPEAVFNYYYTYEGDVPYLTGIYIADKALRDAKISDLDNLLAQLTDYETKTEDGNEIKVLKTENGKPIKTPSNTAIALSEVVTEIATLFTEAVDTYVSTPELRNQIKCEPTGANFNTTSSGLNNIFVSIPQLFDLMEDLAAEKYGVAKGAWTYCYDGKIFANENNHIRNSSLENFKSLADGSGDSVDILDTFADIFVGDWLNAIIDLLDNTISTDNEITKNIPIISGLLNSLGGFGETSIITDVLNGVFQIDRESDYSFTFEAQDTGFTGLSKDNAYFLISNIQTLVDVIMNLVDKFDSNGNGDGDGDNNTNSGSPTYKQKAAKTANADKSTYTNAELRNATDLINNFDKMLSSLLADSSFNGFNIDSVDNILSGVVTFFSNYLGNDCFTDLGKLLNSYVFYITGSETYTPDSKGNVDAKKVYTNESLTGLVVETFLLIEKIVENLLADYYDTYTLDNGTQAQYNLLVEAIEGVISPDAVSIRLDGYEKVQNKLSEYNCWHNAADQTSRGDYKIKLDWGIKAGDKDAFYDALAASLRLITSILGVVMIDTNWYANVVSPVLGALCTKNGIKLDTAAQYAATTNGYHDEVLLGLLRPVSEWINLFLEKPATTLIKSIQGIAGILDDKNGATIASIVKNAITPLVNELKGLGKIFAIDNDKLLPTSLTLQRIINDFTNEKLAIYADTKNIQLGSGEYRYPLSGSNLIPIINSYLESTGITLKQINWNKLSTAKTPAAAFVYILEYLLEVLLDNDNLTAIAELIGNDTFTEIIELLKSGDITAKDILTLLNRILEATDSPTLAYWTFAQYLQEAATGFYYPAGVTKQMADNGVEGLDNLISGLFPLLSSFGVDIGGDSLQAIVNKNLFTNEILTSLATALYGALDGLDPTIKDVLKSLGIVTSTKDVAKILTDKSYGKTFTSAANTIKAQSSWSKVKNVNWGFKDGSSKAQQGFVNALAAILRPLYEVLEIFLSEGTLEINDILYDVITSLDVPYGVQVITISDDKDAPIQLKFSYRMKDGVLRMKFREYEGNRERSKSSELRLDFTSLKDLKDLKLEGTNGYNSAIIPLLEALQCSNISTYAQYKKDVNNAKDNLLLDILNPLIGDSSSSFLNKLLANPVSELTKLLPNIAMYLESDGLVQLLGNLLAPVTYLITDGENPIDLGISGVIEDLLGGSIHDLIIPLVNSLLADSDDPNLSKLQLADINWNKLISLGTKTTYTSKATGTDGKYLTGKMVGNVDQGKVLITVLRYVANLLIDNASVLKNLICSIDAIAKNDTLKSIIQSVFNTISTASADQIVAAVFYLLSGNPQNAFWDYTSYKTGEYTFAYPENMDVDFLKQLPPMLDGLIGSIADLNGLISEALFKDEIISSLATGLYGAIEGVKINDNMNLTRLLAQTDIDFSTSNVARLLVDENYGQTFESASAVIAAAGSWSNVNADSLHWGVTDRDSFFHALVAVLRPLYGVLDVLLNDAYLGLFDVVRLPGSNGYTSSIVPLMEAFSMYNIKTQYQYRQDIIEEYDAILLDIINPIWDLVEDVLNAPLQTVAAIVPNLALFLGNDGLCQVIDNLLTPVSALVDAIRPVVDLNDLLTTLFDALDVDINGLLAKIGVTNFSLDIYDLNKTLKPILSGDALIPLINNILGMIDINGTKLDLKLNPVDWLQLASHGTTVVSASQAATYGSRVFVQGDSSETLIAVLRYLIDTVNTGDNLDKVSALIGGLLGDGVDDNVSGIITQVLGMLEGETDTVISSLVELLQTLGS